MVVFGIKGGREAGAKLINSVLNYVHMLRMWAMLKV